MALSGYPHVTRVSTGIHDPVLSSALYMENGSQALVLIALDLLFLDPLEARSIRGAVAKRLSLPERCVFISCTHTHSAPVANRLLAWQADPAVPPPDPAYLQWVAERVVESAASAAAGARPAGLAWCAAPIQGVGGNRLDPAGLTDREAGGLAIRGADGNLLGLTVIYGMHPTVLHEDSTLISSDFPHYARQELKRQFGSSLTVVYQTGACGNQSPRFVARSNTFAEAERLGCALGRGVAAAVRTLGAKDFNAQPPLEGLLGAVELPRRTLPQVPEAEQQLERCRAHYESLKSRRQPPGVVRTAECAVFGAEGNLMLSRLEESGEIQRYLKLRSPIEVQVVRIGDVCVAGLPGELFAEFALRIKRDASGRVFVVTLVNGELQGYIVTPDAAAQGGYEATTGLFSPAAGDILVKAALELERALAARNPG
jgi:hypothetical protein